MNQIDHTNQTDHTETTTRVARPITSSWRLALVGLVLIPVILACTTAISLDKAPASSLRLSITFDHALVPGSTTDVSVGIMTAPNNFVEAFTGGQTLKIDGVELGSQGSATIPRQPPGGANFYTLVYTDEHGKQTIAHIPAPQVDLAVLHPTANSRVPLPKPAKTGHTQPVATPTANPSDPDQPRPPELADSPLNVRYTLPYAPGSLSHVQGSAVDRYVVRLSVFGQCASGWSQCYPLFAADQPTPTGSATIDDSDSPWGRGFEALAPGPGQITASAEISWIEPASGFQTLFVYFKDDTVNAPITWV